MDKLTVEERVRELELKYRCNVELIKQLMRWGKKTDKRIDEMEISRVIKSIDAMGGYEQ